MGFKTTLSVYRRFVWLSLQTLTQPAIDGSNLGMFSSDQPSMEPCMGRLIVPKLIDLSTWVQLAGRIFFPIRLLPSAMATSSNHCIRSAFPINTDCVDGGIERFSFPPPITMSVKSLRRLSHTYGTLSKMAVYASMCLASEQSSMASQSHEIPVLLKHPMWPATSQGVWTRTFTVNTGRIFPCVMSMWYFAMVIVY